MSKLTIGILLGSFALLAGASLATGCARGGASSAAPDAGGDAARSLVTADALAAIARAEDTRQVGALPAEAAQGHDPVVRRAVARALARILQADDAPLLRGLEDEDPETAAWAAYALGEACKGHEDGHARALAARLASLSPAPPGTPGPPIDLVAAILRAIGRCGGDSAEPTLVAALRALHAGDDVGPAEAAAYALGDLAARSGAVSVPAANALLEAAQPKAGAGASHVALEAALYPFARAEASEGDEFDARLTAVARAALDRPGPTRVFAVRALGRTGDTATPPILARLLASDAYTPSERAEAAHALARFHRAGQAALADALDDLAPDGPTVVRTLGSDRFGVLLTAIGAVGDDPPKKTADALWKVAHLEVGAGDPPRARRASALRCAAAEKLARGGWDAEILRGCDVGDGAAGERARLGALDRGSLTGPRRAAWVDLVRSQHVVIREAALGAIARHPELGDAARAAIAQALGETALNEAGLVATAATLVSTQPARVFVLAASERRAALDPRAPPPSSNPAREVDAAVAAALRAALARPWSEDLVEVRAALVDAALAAGLDEGRAAAKAACRDANVTIRARAARALTAAGEPGVACPVPPPEAALPGASAAPAAPAVTSTKGARVVFDTDAGPLAVRFDPALAPVAVAHFIALARAGFYRGVTLHRVVPGFVVQFGDHGGDGFGGSGELLRCETSPLPFAPLDVGVALAGRDTGSSQLFVTLARHPHLDGEYARVGHAEGDWDAAAEGDVIRAVRVED